MLRGGRGVRRPDDGRIGVLPVQFAASEVPACLDLLDDALGIGIIAAPGAVVGELERRAIAAVQRAASGWPAGG